MADVLLLTGSFVFVTILINAMVGDSIFISAVIKNPQLHTSVFVFLSNECLSDVVYISSAIFFLVESWMDRWVFGDAWCRILGFLNNTCLTVSILSLSVGE